jgi:hypothetical protein
MDSPSSSPSRNLQGASHITGETTRGQALGNVFNISDVPDVDKEVLVPRTGKVQLYGSLVDPTQVKPSCVLKVNVSFSMAPILKSIAAKWSPIESKLLMVI